MIAHAERFWSKVDKSGGPDACWLWMAGINRQRGGYGQFGIGNAKRRAHRYAWELTHGDPGESVVMHKCDTPRCCNPSHLALGTQQENLRDCKTKGRTARGDRNGARSQIDRMQRGERRWNAKLTTETVRLIRDARGTHEQIAATLGVSRRTVGRVLQGVAWKHV